MAPVVAPSVFGGLLVPEHKTPSSSANSLITRQWTGRAAKKMEFKGWLWAHAELVHALRDSLPKHGPNKIQIGDWGELERVLLGVVGRERGLGAQAGFRSKA